VKILLLVNANSTEFYQLHEILGMSSAGLYRLVADIDDEAAVGL
jgi:hypothetical protein